MIKKDRIEQIGLLLSVAVFLFAAWMLARYLLRDIRSDRLRDAWTESFEETATTEPAGETKDMKTGTDPADDTETEDAYLTRSFDFAAMKRKNPDVIAWLCIPDTPIDYPVVRHPSDDNWYLKHNADREYDYYGAIFVLPGTELSDLHLIIHGHNMRSGRMFGTLKKYRKADYGKNHPYLYFYTPGYTYKAAVFSAFSCMTGSNPFLTGFSPGSEEYETFLQDLKENSGYSWGMEPDPKEKCITLSTCVSRGIAAERYTIHTSMVEKHPVKQPIIGGSINEP